MKWDTLYELSKNGKNPKIYVVDFIDPFLFTGFVKRVYEDDAKRVDLFPFCFLNVSQNNGLGGTFDRYGSPFYTGLILEPQNTKGLVHITTSFEAHKKQTIDLAFDLCEGKLELVYNYLKLAKKLKLTDAKAAADYIRKTG